MEKKYQVYKYTSPSGKVYIGQTCRKLSYRAKKGFGYIGCTAFYNAIVKYGWDSFIVEVVSKDLSKKEADWLENYLILYYHSNERDFGYNLTLGGEGNVGYHHSEETKKKISQSHFGITHSDETKKHLSQIRRGKKMSEEEKKKRSIGNKYSNCKQLLCIETGIIYYSAKDAAKQINCCYTNLVSVLSGNGIYKGYYWKYIK